MNKHLHRGSPARAALLGLVLLGAARGATAQTAYTWSPTSGTNWSTAANWTPSGAPSAGDTATLSNLGAASTIGYDAGASGTLGTLNMVQTASAVATTLAVANSLTLTGGGSIYSTKASGYESIQLSGSAALTIASGASFTVGTNSASLVLPSSSANEYITTASGYTGSGVLVNGTLNLVTGAASLSSLYVNAPVAVGAGGTFNVDSETTGATRAFVLGNFTTSASANTIEATGAYASKSILYLQGSTIAIGSGTTFSGFANGTSNPNGAGVVFTQSTGGTQTVSLGAITGFTIRNLATASTTTTKLSSSTTSGSVGNAVDSLGFYSSGASDSMVLQLAGNLNFAGGSYTTPFYYTLTGGTSAATAITATIDLHGYAYDATAGTASTAFAPTGTSLYNYAAITNTGLSSIPGGEGIFKAASFNLAGADVGVGAGVILQATSGSGANDLGMKDGAATTTIDPASTFYYTGGVGTATLKTSTNSRPIGGLIVGNGSAASSLQLASAITAAGNVTPAANSILDLNGNTLTLSGSASLTGTGTVQNTSATASASVVFAGGATGGISPGGAGAAGTLSFAAPTQAITLSLANSTSTFDVTSAGLGAGTFDTLSLSNVALNLTGGTLVINFGSGTYNGSIQLFTLTNGSTITGTLASLTSNLGASETLTLDSTGLLTFSAVAVPEPPLFLMLGAGCGAVFLVRRSRIAGGRGCRS